MAFRLLLPQEKASEWWEAPCRLSRLCHWDFLPYVDPLGMRDFWVTRQEESLALAQALQCCAERSGTPPGVLCNAAQDLQRCMASLMQLEGDEIVRALLLGPVDNRPRVPPTSEEEALPHGDELEPQEAQEDTTSPLNAQKPPSLKNQPSSLMLQAHLPLQPQHQIPAVTSPRTPEEPGAGLDPSICQPSIQTAPMPGSLHTWRKRKSYWVGGGSSGPSAIRVPSPSAMLRYKSWQESRLWVSGYL